MNLLHSPRGGRIIKGVLFALSVLNLAHAADAVATPSGTLTIDNAFVRVGVKSQVGWNITYPTNAQNLITKDPNGTCTPKVKVRMQVKVLAAAFSNDTTYWTVKGYVKVGTTSTNIFTGTQQNVNSSSIVYDKVVAAGSIININAATTTDGYTCSTSAGDKSVVALFNGEALPAYQKTTYPNMQLNVKDYISSYMNSNNTAKIGDNQIIFLGDFNGFGNTGYDLNDYVLLVTFTAA